MAISIVGSEVKDECKRRGCQRREEVAKEKWREGGGKRYLNR